MKADIHPKLNPVVFVDSSNGTEFPTLSTLTAEKTKKIDGVEHFVILVDISSASHPFFTGKQTLIDTAGRVDKFRARAEAAKQKQEAASVSKAKKEVLSKETPAEKISRKAKENTEKKEAEKLAESKPAKKTVKPEAEKKAPAKKTTKKEYK